MTTTVYVKGSRGIQYSYNLFAENNTTWNKVAGNYLFLTEQNVHGVYVILYAGVAVSFSDRMPSHERWAEAARLGAAWMAARVNHNAFARHAEEADIVATYNPVLNVQHRTAAWPGGLAGLLNVPPTLQSPGSGTMKSILGSAARTSTLLGGPNYFGKR